jgi:hypothetical protein
VETKGNKAKKKEDDERTRDSADSWRNNGDINEPSNSFDSSKLIGNRRKLSSLGSDVRFVSSHRGAED